jgi:hypothetical protein
VLRALVYNQGIHIYRLLHFGIAKQARRQFPSQQFTVVKAVANSGLQLLFRPFKLKMLSIVAGGVKIDQFGGLPVKRFIRIATGEDQVIETARKESRQSMVFFI